MHTSKTAKTVFFMTPSRPSELYGSGVGRVKPSLGTMSGMNLGTQLHKGILVFSLFMFHACSAQDSVVASQNPRVVADPPRRLLFIGNSLTYSNEGIYTHL